MPTGCLPGSTLALVASPPSSEAVTTKCSRYCFGYRVVPGLDRMSVLVLRVGVCATGDRGFEGREDLDSGDTKALAELRSIPSGPLFRLPQADEVRLGPEGFLHALTVRRLFCRNDHHISLTISRTAALMQML